MATLQSVRRLFVTGGFAVALAAAPMVAVATAAPAAAQAPVSACPIGEEVDIFTGNCVPHTVPNTTRSMTSLPYNPSIPTADGVPCTGGYCPGLSGGNQVMGPQPSPHSEVSSSPTVTSHP